MATGNPIPQAFDQKKGKTGLSKELLQRLGSVKIPGSHQKGSRIDKLGVLWE